MEWTRSIEGRRALVTGAASGIGRATARVLAGEGAHVAATDRPGAPVEEVAQGIGHAGGHCVAREMDVASEASVRDGVEALAGDPRRSKGILHNVFGFIM